MSRWYRAYEGTVTDAKLAEVALVVGCSRSVVIATWHACLENAATVNDGGRIDIPSRRIAAVLCEPFDTIESVIAGFETVGMLLDSQITSWKKRQYESDSSTERSRRSRAAKRNGDATLQQQHATPPETETETETDITPSGVIAREPKTKTAAKRKQPLPNDWEPMPFAIDSQCAKVMATWLPSRLENQVERFRAYHVAKGTVMVDWQAAWRTWVLNSVDFARATDPPPTDDFARISARRR